MSGASFEPNLKIKIEETGVSHSSGEVLHGVCKLSNYQHEEEVESALSSLTVPGGDTLVRSAEDLIPDPTIWDRLGCSEQEARATLAWFKVRDEDSDSVKNIAHRLSQIQDNASLSVTDLIFRASRTGYTRVESPEEIIERISEPGWNLKTVLDSEGSLWGYVAYQVTTFRNLRESVEDNKDKDAKDEVDALGEELTKLSLQKRLGPIDDLPVCANYEVCIDPKIKQHPFFSETPVRPALLYGLLHVLAVNDASIDGARFGIGEARDHNPAASKDGAHIYFGWVPSKHLFESHVTPEGYPKMSIPIDWRVLWSDFRSTYLTRLTEQFAEVSPQVRAETGASSTNIIS